MRTIRTLWWACVLIGLGATVAHARGEYARPGAHASVQAVVGVPLWEGQLQSQIAAIAPGTPPAQVGVSGGLDLRAGYRFHERVAAEMGFDWVSAYPVTLGGQSAGGAANWMFYVDAKLYLLKEKVQPFVVLGMGAYHLDYTIPGSLLRADATSFSPRLGGGVDYYVSYRWGLTAEVDYVIGTRQLTNFDRVSVSLGAFYRF